MTIEEATDLLIERIYEGQECEFLAPLIAHYAFLRHPELREPFFTWPSCCSNEQRNMQGGCDNCGDPCL
jgi:hypothetical protein